MISMSFQIVGFLLTYLLHTTHAAKNGSLAGLGITLVQFGHDFDPNAPQADGGATGGSGDIVAGISGSDWFAYILMIVGWFILIRSISDFLRARRHEQLVLQSPDRGLSVPVVADNERPETAV
jgi:hypothetical protein